MGKNSDSTGERLRYIKTTIKFYWNKLLNAIISGENYQEKVENLAPNKERNETNINNNKRNKRK